MSASNPDPSPEERSPRGLHQDVTVAFVLLALCGVGYWLTADFDTVPAMLAQNVPPTFFPRLVLGLIGVLTVIMLLIGLKKPRVEYERIKPMVPVTGMLVATAPLLIAPLGTFPTLFLVTLVLPIVWGERRRRAVITLAVLLPIAVYLIFTLALGVRFPTGALAALFA